MTSTERVYGADEVDFAKELVGRSITLVDDYHNFIFLDDGTKLKLEDAQGCCAWFQVEDVRVTHDYQHNIITAVTRRELPDTENGFTITVLAGVQELMEIDIDGSLGSGYYCQSIDLLVHRPEKGETL